MRKNSFTMGAVKPWKRMVYLLTPMFTEFVRICVWWRTSPDLIAVPAFRRMTCPGCVALWFKWDGGESLSSSDLPKAVERSFLFLQLWVQSDKQYNLIWIFFCLFVFGIIWRMMMKEPQQSLSLGPNWLNFWSLYSQKGNTPKYCKLFYTESTKEALYSYKAVEISEYFLMTSLGFVKGRGKVSDEKERKTCSQLGPLSSCMPFTLVQMAGDFFPWSRIILDYLWGMQVYRKLKM